MHAGESVLELLVVIAAAAVGAALFERARLPAIVGFLLTGALVGPYGLGLVQDPEQVRLLAEFGVAFLLFEIGLELPVDELRRSWRTALVSGALQVVLSVAAVGALGVAIGLPTPAAVLVGMLVALSSTALVMRVLGQLDEVDAPHGRLALGILLFQDLCIVPFLLAVPILSGEVPSDPLPLARAVGEAVAKLVALYAVARFALPWVLERVVRLRSSDVFSVFAFLLAMGSAVVAELVGLTLAVGAFIAGLVVSASPYARQLFAEVAPLRGVLLGVFFTAVGMLLDPRAALAAWPGVVGYVVGVVVFKAALVVALVAGVLRFGLTTAIRTGLSLAQTGEFSFVLAAAAAAAGLLTGELEQVFVAGSILTLVATPFLIRGSGPVARWVGGLEGGPVEERETRPSEHVVIIGFGLSGRTVARVLKASGIAYTAVESNPQTVAEARAAGEPVFFGDATRPVVLEHAGVSRARLVIAATNDPQSAREVLSVVRSLAPDVRIVVRTRWVRNIDALFELGANEVVAEEFEASLDLSARALRTFDVPDPAIAQLCAELRDEGYELIRGPLILPIDPWVSEMLEEVSPEWIEVPSGIHAQSTIAGLGIRARSGANVLAVRRGSTTTANPGPETRLEVGDELLVLADAKQLTRLRALLADATASA